MSLSDQLITVKYI